MPHRIRVEITGRDKFWSKAVMVEWEHQFPDRKLVAEPDGFYLIEAEWLADLQRVGEQCFAKVLVAPEIPSRLSWLRRMIDNRESKGW